MEVFKQANHILLWEWGGTPCYAKACLPQPCCFTLLPSAPLCDPAQCVESSFLRLEELVTNKLLSISSVQHQHCVFGHFVLLRVGIPPSATGTWDEKNIDLSLIQEQRSWCSAALMWEKMCITGSVGLCVTVANLNATNILLPSSSSYMCVCWKTLIVRKDTEKHIAEFPVQHCVYSWKIGSNLTSHQ